MGIQIYKASAGSGKTYTLVYEYIKYLFKTQLCETRDTRHETRDTRCETRDVSTLNLHRGILAVTFTNKATAEMKERIVKALYELSKGEKGDYVEKLRSDLPALKEVEDEVIAKMAERFLIDILQDYTQFRVSTIDGFFQQIVRSFARELNLNNQYQVELETDKVLEMAVDNMLASLSGNVQLHETRDTRHETRDTRCETRDTRCETRDLEASDLIVADTACRVPTLGENSDGEGDMLLEWLTEFASEKVEDGRSWNPRSAILGLANLILKEDYLSQKEKFGFDLKRLKEYRDNIREIIKKFDEDLKRVCDRAKGVLSGVDGKEVFGDNRISRFDYDYLKGKNYELSATFVKGAESDDLTTWCKKKYQKDGSLQSVVTELHECVKRIVELCDVEGERFREYQTAKIVNSYIYILGILNEIDNQAMEICKSKDCLLISSTSDFINKIIDGSDTPFIYEKVGVWTEHFMIDEFQDTSKLQWKNFVPLLREAVSRGNESMIVGDVKQSIYRWRNGDWKILHEGVEKEFGNYVKDEPLSDNYRSSVEVIEFNNRLYEELPKLADAQLQTQGMIENDNYLQNIYAGSKQGVGKKDAAKGYVRVEFLADDEEDKELKWKVQSLNKMVEQMRELGHYGETAVLVRTNKEAQEVAERLKDEGVPFYSSEALCVADNVAVRFIVAVLEYLMQPYEQLFRANVVALHREVCRGRMVDAEDYELMSYRGDDYAKWEQLVFGDEIAERFGRVKYMPLMSMIEALIGLFSLNEIEGSVHQIYMQSFKDKVQSYAIDGTLDIRSLLEYWGVQGEKTFIAMPEGGDAVRIMTIHKAKGLEFGIVFIPFVDWNMGFGKGNIQLVGTERKSRKNHLFIDEVSVVPINTQSSTKLFNSEFREDVVKEYLAACLDVLNVLYVATTRASQQLYIYCNNTKSKDEKKKESNAITQISIAKMLRSMLLGEDEEENVYESNDKVAYSPKNKVDKEDVENVELRLNMDSLPTEEEVAERAQLRFKYSEDTGEGDVRRYGVMMHGLFEHIKTMDDVDSAIEWVEREGENVDGLRSEVDEILAIEGVAELFDERWRVMNEAEIFDGENGRVYRPDRVMIDDVKNEVVVVDYKFGEYADDAHQKYLRQVGRYVRLIKEMGYDARGYILYATDRKLFALK
ncbi:MAG: UvrD-helicase domain-containing protein [Paludibacteraceae bacterium]|nr:UvrD-helicase domain-containing protein [Paludibacteraceae bacterium]